MLEKIGPYQFLDVLGRGGMGTVFKGKHQETGELHAVKVLAPNYSQEPHFRARFESEIKALIKLDHPNIVRLISFGQEDGNMFFAMEMVDGKSLFEVQRSGHKFTPHQCLSIAEDVCKGLKHAHDRGIIHRDLKPGNLMMTKDRVVKITDFGIAKRYGASQNTGNNILGTMDYMSPEQAKGEQVTAKSDIYSLGTVLFTLLSGKPPFTANSIEESFRNLTRIPPPYVSSVVPDVPHEVDRLIRRMMEKKPEKRLATAQATLHQIKEAAQVMKDTSEAKTAQNPPLQSTGKVTSVFGGRTEDDSSTRPDKPAWNRTHGELKNKPFDQSQTSSEGKTQKRPSIATGKTRLSPPVDSPSVATGDDGRESPSGEFELDLAAVEDEPVQLDYFNTVTEEEREIVTDEVDVQRSKGVVPLLLGLLAVIAVAAVGSWYSLQNPSADELFSQIEPFRDRPHRVVKQTDQFVSLYPDDERFDDVKNMNEAGKSIDFYHDLVNRLSVQARIPGESRMTEIEDQFHDIIRLADDDRKAADAKMAAFIIVHDGNEDLDQRDKDCVAAAKGFRLKQNSIDPQTMRQRVKNIHATVLRAASLENDSEAIKVYRSLIRLHGDEDWGDQDELRVDLLAEIEQRVRRLESGSQ